MKFQHLAFALSIVLGSFMIFFVLGMLMDNDDGGVLIFFMGMFLAFVSLILGIVFTAIGKKYTFWGIGFLIGAVLVFILGWAGCFILVDGF